ncbi:MAG: HD domain-containing protein [Lachnospiraceae bacterium]
MKRIRDVDMNCGMNYTAFPRFARIGAYSRYEHSLGVSCILWRVTKDPAAALAGLFHDIAAPAFSHVVDFARGDYQKQEATERETEGIIRDDPVIREVLEELGLSVQDVSSDSAYPLANCKAPGLCADRLEYTLGNMVNYGFAKKEEAKTYLDHVTIRQNEAGEEELAFSDAESGIAFAKRALLCGSVYSCPEDRYGMEILAELLKKALERGILSEADLWTTEPRVSQKLSESPLASDWAAFGRMQRLEVREDFPKEGENSGWRSLRVKKRWIDPLCGDEGRASQIDPAFQKDLAAFCSDPQKEVMRDPDWDWN